MDPSQTPTLGSGFAWLVHFVGELAFQWLPATIAVIGNTGNPPQGVAYYPAPVTPATAEQVSDYIHAAATPGIYDKLAYDWGVFTALSLFVSLLLAALVVYCVTRILQIRRHERMRFEAAAHPVAAQDISRTQLRWDRIVEEANSDNEQSWRLAILEADIMLNELLDSLGYKGETMADKMRQVERNDFNSIDLAWEAHRARNAIAHQGAQLSLSSREVRRIISLYEKIFREFKLIQ